MDPIQPNRFFETRYAGQSMVDHWILISSIADTNAQSLVPQEIDFNFGADLLKSGRDPLLGPRSGTHDFCSGQTVLKSRLPGLCMDRSSLLMRSRSGSTQ